MSARRKVLPLAVGQCWIVDNRKLQPEMEWVFQIVAVRHYKKRRFWLAVKRFLSPMELSMSGIVVFDDTGHSIPDNSLKLEWEKDWLLLRLSKWKPVWGPQ